MLPRLQAQAAAQGGTLDRRQARGTLRHNDYLGTATAAGGLAQPAGGQQGVADKETVVIGEQDVEPGTDVAVLKGIVEHDAVRPRRHGQQPADAVAAVGVDSHYGAGMAAVDLQRFVADVGRRGARPGQLPAVAASLVASAEQSHAQPGVLEQAHEIIGVGRLARTADSKVSHADDGQVERGFGQYAGVEQQVARPDAEAVKPGQRTQQVIDRRAGSGRRHGQWRLSS